ncbi:MAG TPA: peptidoglycan-binding domain-containing protein [Candidatus Acidoferrales bacterium]|nr:peptidoglycan-binding domain-containing protein [Candidatus Acidoferrales bacterium]
MKWLIAVAAVLALACVTSPSCAAAAPSPTASATPAHHKTRHKTKRHHAKKVRGQKAPTADRITEIQTALSRDGYYQGEPNGKWDSNTVAAVQKFQSANGMDANGKLDAPTLQKLGLGSDIAGVSAPKPIVPGSPNSTPSSSAPSAVPQTSTSSRGGPVASAASSPSSSPSSSSQDPPAPTSNH